MTVNVELVLQKIIEMAVLKTSFRFPEINLGFVTSAQGAGHLTPNKSLGRGHLSNKRARMVGKLKKKILMSNARGGGGGHGHPWI